MSFLKGDVVIYTNHKLFKELLGQVGIVEDVMLSKGQEQLVVKWMNNVTFQGITSDRSKVPSQYFDKISMNVLSWKKD